MIGRAEVNRQRQQLDATFARAAGVKGDAEVADFSRYLCVLVSGYLEQAVIELLLDYVRRHSSPSVHRHVDARLRRFTTATSQRIIELMGSFDPDWRKDMETFLVDEYKDAVDSIVNLRHAIAHGRYAGVTYTRVQNYYGKIKTVVTHIADLCDK